MKTLLIISMAIFCHFSIINADLSDLKISTLFEEWKIKYGKKNAANNTGTKSPGFSRFKKYLMSISKQNLKYGTKKSLFKMALNARANEDEQSLNIWNELISADYNKIDRFQARVASSSPTNFPPAPASWDWRQKGLVTNVEDQGYYCGSCYAFAANCALEGQIAKKYGVLNKLSKQQIVDCSRSFGNFGCNGGYITKAYNYIYYNPGLVNDNDYKYTGFDQKCQNTSTSKSSIVDYNFVIGDEENLKRALYSIGPLAVGMRASFENFYFYSDGIFDDTSCTGKIDHAVCIVGYDTDNTTSPPTDYWIVKNSWSVDWGEDGYFRILRGSNMCNISTYVIYPSI